jgi:hypothetical protein
VKRSRATRPSPRLRSTLLQQLESRRLFCLAHVTSAAPEELIPGFVATPEQPYLSGPSDGPEAAGDAEIVWVNRAIGDGFDEVFGSNAAIARGVVDQVLIDFARMVGNFGYSIPSAKFQLSLSMMSPGSNGLGAAASLFSLIGGKPFSAGISIQRGLDGLGSGFFLDPTPADHSEFLGTIENPFAGNAPSTSPAFGLADFYTLVGLELTHGLGLFGNYTPGWDNYTRPIGISELGEGYTPATGTSVGQYWVFEGPSIKHLLTSNNGGRNGGDFGEPVHSAGHGSNATPVVVNFDGQQWVSVNDIGNAVYERSRRYLPSYNFALMFRDAYGFAGVNPATYNSFHATQISTGEVIVRLPTAGSADDLTLGIDSHGDLVVAYNIGIDSPGVGALPGYGDLPHWITAFKASTVTSVRIETGDGFDSIWMDNVGAIPVMIDFGPGADSLLLTGTNNVTLLGNQDLGSLNIDAGSFVKLQPGIGAALLTTGGISGAGVLDLADGALIDRSAAPATALRSRLLAGYNGGAWNGSASAIRSNVVAGSAASDTLGLGVASQIKPTTLGGFALQPSDRVVRYTLAGDADLDRTVNFDDLLRLASNYNTPSGSIGSQGEFSYDASGAINFDDLLLLAANYNGSLPGTLGGAALRGAPVPGAVVDDGDPDSIGADVLA